MKQLLISLIVLFAVVQVKSQEKQIFTKSVQLEEFIPFIVGNYRYEKEVFKHRNITFLIPVSSLDYVDRTGIILKQSFRLLSNRLHENDNITIVGYGAINGVIIKSRSPKELKAILLALDNVETSISRVYKDGIQLGYDLSEKNYDDNAINSMILIRASNIKIVKKNKNSNKKAAKEKKKRKSILWLTLIGLTPEIISALKND